MKKIVAIAAVAVLAVVFAGCKKSHSGYMLRLADLGEQLRPLQNQKDIDIVTGKIKYKTVGMPKYDRVSKRAAEIYGMVMQFDHLLKMKEEKKLPAGLDVAVIIAFGVVAIPEAIKNSVELVKTAKTLNPKNDFTGVKATKAVKATALITQVVDRMKKAGETGAEVVKKLAGKGEEKPAEAAAPAEGAKAAEGEAAAPAAEGESK